MGLDSEIVVRMLVGETCANSPYKHMVQKCKTLMQEVGGRLPLLTNIERPTGQLIGWPTMVCN